MVPAAIIVCAPPGVSSSSFQPLTSSGVSRRLMISIHSGPVAGAGMISLIRAIGVAVVMAVPPIARHASSSVNGTKDDRMAAPVFYAQTVALCRWCHGRVIHESHPIVLVAACGGNSARRYSHPGGEANLSAV